MLFMTAMVGIVMSNNVISFGYSGSLPVLVPFCLLAIGGINLKPVRVRAALAITGAGGLALLAGLLLIGDIVGSYDLDVILASKAPFNLMRSTK